jgi:hypothetical protein
MRRWQFGPIHFSVSHQHRNRGWLIPAPNLASVLRGKTLTRHVTPLSSNPIVLNKNWGHKQAVYPTCFAYTPRVFQVF